MRLKARCRGAQARLRRGSVSGRCAHPWRGIAILWRLLAAAAARAANVAWIKLLLGAARLKLVGSVMTPIFLSGVLTGALNPRSFAYEPVLISVSQCPYPIAFPLHLPWVMVNSHLFT